MRKRILAALSFLILLIALTGCGVELTESEVDVDKVLEPTYNEDMEEIHEIIRSQDLEDFTLVTKYDTIDYDLNKWQIIDNKAIRMSVWTEGLPSGWDAIIEHVHIDMFVTNKYDEIPTLLQDTMDDSFHGYQQEGFVISDDIVYENIFGIIGATSEMQHSVDYAGSYTLELKDLREKRFMDSGYNSNTMQVIYDVMVKKPNNDFYETIAVYDEVVIPVGYE